ncbi:MAG: GNAT family N-acetyltransferase [Pseudomonadota bacterium]
MSTFSWQKQTLDRRGETRGRAVLSTAALRHDCRIDCLDSLEDMQTLQAQWEELETRAAGSFQYFQTYQWCAAWCRTYLAGREARRPPRVMIYTLFVGGELAMVWPLVIQHQASGIRLLTMLSDPLGQYADILVDRDLVDEDLGRQIWDRVRATPDIDAIQLLRFPTSSFIAECIGVDGYEEKALQEAHYFDFSGFDAWDDVHASLKRSARKNRNNRRNKLAQTGKVRYECVLGGSDRYAELVGLALDMKKVWLKEKGLLSTALSDDLALEFLAGLVGKDVGRGMPPQGATAHVLTVDTTPVGIEIGMILGRHYYSYLGAFDWQWRNYSPGVVQMESTQKWAMENQVEKFDLMGDPAAYKSHWSNATQPLKSVIVPISLRGFIYAAVWRARLRPALKQLAKAIGPNGRKTIKGLLTFRSGDQKSS